MSNRNFEQAQGIQHRTISELRTSGDEYALVGMAARYNSLSHDLGGFKERIAPGTFKRSLEAGDEVKALFNHDPSQILGRRANGSLKLEDTPEGLRFRCQLNPNSQTHRDLWQNVLTGLVDQCSFAFTVPQGGDLWETGRDDDGKECQIRTLKNVDLLDVSIVTSPAYEATSVAARTKMGYGKKSPAFAPDVVALMRQARQAMNREFINQAKRAHPYPAPYDYATLRMHLDTCSAMADCAFATADTIEDLLDSWPEDYEDDSRSFVMKKRALHYAFREAHRGSIEALSEAQTRIAVALLHLGRVTNKTSSKVNGGDDN